MVLESFEHWYANQVKYKKVAGPPPGVELKAYSYSIPEIATLLGVCDSTVYESSSGTSLKRLRLLPGGASVRWTLMPGIGHRQSTALPMTVRGMQS